MSGALDALAAATARALPPLSPDQRRVGLAVYRLLAAGARADAAAVATRTGLALGQVEALLQELPTAGVDDGAVVAFLGMQRQAGHHRLRFGDQTVGTWCAWDTLFLPALVGRPGLAESRCPVTGDPVRVEVDPTEGVVAAEPADVRLSFLAGPEPFDGDVITGFCRWIHFLSGPEAADAWVGRAAAAAAAAGRPPAPRPALTVLSLSDGFALGRRTNRTVFGLSG